jgi:hypothetical protein
MAEQTAETPWEDPNVTAALKAGRTPDEISLIECPACGVAGYYNDGSHFGCRSCGASYACITEDEEPPPDHPYLLIDDAVLRLDDWDAFDPPDVP